MLMVLEIAPERNGCVDAIIFTWPVQLIDLPPPAGASEQSNTGRCSGFKLGAPSTVPCLSMCETISHIDKQGTVEGAPNLKPEHLPVFDCSLAPAGGGRSISWTGHVKMMASTQPFLSGAISK